MLTQAGNRLQIRGGKDKSKGQVVPTGNDKILPIFAVERAEKEKSWIEGEVLRKNIPLKGIANQKYLFHYGDLEREIEELTKNQKRYQNKVSHFRKYEEYLEKVRTAYNDQYPEMSDILNRYQTLKKSNDDLIKTR